MTDTQLVGESFQWSQLLANFVLTIIVELIIILCSILVFVGVIKIVQANIHNKDIVQQVEQKQNQHNQNEQCFNAVNLTLNQLHKSHQTFVIFYSLYKQLLYLRSGAYHGTNMTSIFATLKKQKPKQNESSLDFESISLQNLRHQITSNVKSFICTFQNTIELLLSSNLQVTKLNQYLMKKNESQINIRVSDLFKYIIPFRSRLSQLKSKISQLDKSLDDANQQNNDQQFIELVKSSVFLTNKIKQLLKTLKESVIQKTPEDYHEKQLPTESKQEQINSVLKRITNGNESKQMNQNENVLAQKKHSQILTNLARSIEEFAKSRHQSFINYNNPVKFMEKQISDLNKLSEQVKLSKSTLQKEQFPHQIIQNEIKIYSTTNSQLSQKLPQSQTDTNIKFSTQQSTVHQGQTAFSAKNKLSFIKQLDRLMVRNKIRKQLQQMEERMKLQENLESLENSQIQQNSNVILEKI